MAKNTYKLSIYGFEYVISAEDSAEYMEALAKSVEERLRTILKGGKLSTMQASVLVALELADEAKKATPALALKLTNRELVSPKYEISSFLSTSVSFDSAWL